MTTSTFPTTALALLALVALALAPLACADPPREGLLLPSWQNNEGTTHAQGLFITEFDFTGNSPYYADQDFASSVAIQSDGKVVVGGTSWNHYSYTITLPNPPGGAIHSEADQFACVLQRYNADGSFDTSFGTEGTVVYNLGQINTEDDCTIKSTNIESNGQILVSGYGSVSGTGSSSPLQMLLNADGSFDTSFGTGGVIVSDDHGTFAQTVQLNGGGQGVFSVGQERNSGTGDLDFQYLVGGLDNPQDVGHIDISGDSHNDGADAAVIEWDGGATKELYLVGSTRHPGTANAPTYVSCAVVALKSVNSAPFTLDTAFSGDGKLVFDDPVPGLQNVSTDCNAAVARPRTGSAWNTGIIVGGERAVGTGNNAQSVYLLVEIGADGTLTYHDNVPANYLNFPTDWPVFNDYGLSVRNSINAMALQGNGMLLIAGSAGESGAENAPSDMGLLRLKPDFTRDDSFSPIPLSLDSVGNSGQDESASAVALDPARSRAIVVGSRSYDRATSPDYDWMLGGVSDVSDRIFGDNFDGPTYWVY